MELINQNGKIYLKFQSNYKTIKRSLKLEYNKKNLKFALTTLLPIFQKISHTKPQNAKIKTNQNQKTSLKKLKIENVKIPAKPYLLSHFCAIVLANLTLRAKISTIKTATINLNRFFDFLPDLPVKSYLTNDLQIAIKAMQSANLSNSTINSLLSYPQIAFKLAQKQGKITLNPINFIKKPRKISKIKQCFTKEQIKLLLDASDGELQTFLYIAFFTGARSGEILALQKSDFDFNANKINICKNQTRFELTTPKNGKFRTINLLQPLKKHILSLNLANDRLFTKDYFQIYYEFKKLLLLLGLPPCGLHTIRHSFCSHLLHGGIQAPLVAHTLGHSNLDMVNRVYSHFLENRSDLRNLNRAMKL